eukprot:GFUD01052493.1.p1 GENE.GFUD01052493.1~~GFUD01052493.1.p1  ORF type:complete len:525 (+),score=121.69 GFUD01052493.1:215-1576(+)
MDNSANKSANLPERTTNGSLDKKTVGIGLRAPCIEARRPAASFLFVVLWLLVYPVSCVHMDWGDNPNLVRESKPIQGREHIKLLVALVGGHIDLECQVLLTSHPISKISWKLNGASINNSEKYIVESNQDGVFVEEHFKIDNVTEDMDGTTLTCGYAKGNYADRVEAVLTVFKLDIEGDICKKCTGNLKLIFKESRRSSQDETNMDRRIRAKIAELTFVPLDEITVEKDKYSVTLPIDIVKKNQEIIAMKPELFKNVVDPSQGGTALIIIFVAMILGIPVFAYLYHRCCGIGKKHFLHKRKLPRHDIKCDDLKEPGFRACREAGCEMCVHINKVSGTNIIKKCCSGDTLEIKDEINCRDNHIVYILSCTKPNCMKQEIRDTKSSGVEMFRKRRKECQHFQMPGHTEEDMEFVVVATEGNDIKRQKIRNTLIKTYKIRNDLNEPEAELAQLVYM